jgi:copper(I)-binding protein
MLLDIKEPLRPGATVPVTLVISRNGKTKTVAVRAEVRAVTDSGSVHDR